MRNLLYILLLAPLLAFTQVPQGVGYQGVATDAAGFELINQSISIRASVISGSATGTIEWQETHNTSTDTFGLFNLTIGQGTSTGNGAQTSFADITWGANTHFLKIEMDVNGGTNYSHMGTNQMMSVPYALYAENANIDYDSISTLLSNDSTFITTISGGIGGGCDFKYPEGYEGSQITFDLVNSYTVPLGKTLYVTNIKSSGRVISINGIDILDGYSNSSVYLSQNNPYVVSNSQVISSNATYPNEASFNGFLIDSDLISLTFDLVNSYTVPLGKTLYVTNIKSSGRVISIDGIDILDGYSNSSVYSGGLNPYIVSNSQVISSNATYLNEASFNGYLVDENYFADCGGGGGSSSSTIDSSYIDSLVQFYSNGNGGGCDINLPEGIYGDPVIHDLHTSSYTVPAGKNLYLTNIYCIQGSGETYIDGIVVSKGYNNYDANRGSKPFIASSGQIITTSASYAGVNTISGFLVDANVTPITQDLYSSSYTVPSGKKLYLTNIYCIQGSAETYIDGIVVSKGYNNYDANRGTQAFILNSGQIITTSVIYAGVNTINGYLADENYFADCEGVGSSSSTSSLDSTTIANMIASARGGSGFDIRFPEGIDGEPITELFTLNNSFTVPAGKNLYILDIHHRNSNSVFVSINGNQIGKGLYDADYNTNYPLVLSENDILSINDYEAVFNGMLVDKIIGISPITELFTLNNSYTVPAGKNLYILDIHHRNSNSAFVSINGNQIGKGLYDADYNTNYPLVLSENDILSINDYEAVFNGYLADDDFFSNSGGTSAGSGNMIVSNFGDTLTLNGQSIIVPGISYPNTPSSLFSTVTDIDGNTYQTVSIYGTEWMMEDLKTTTYSNGDPIIQSSDITQPSYNFDANDPQYIYYNTLAIRDSRNVCPVGWHVPTISEWESMILLFGDKVPTGNMFGFRYENAAPALKSFNDGLNGNWGTNTVTNISHLSIKELGRMFPNNNNASMGNYSYSITSTIVPSAPNHNWNVTMEDTGFNVDHVHIDSDDYYFNTRCVKD